MITQENIPYTADEIKAMVKTCEKYNKALEIAKEVYHDHRKDRYWRDWLTKLFPELKESKDERIKHCLIEHIKCNKNLNWSLFQWFKPDTIISWLEKQGEQKHFSDFKAKDWYVSKVDGKIYNMTYNPNDKVEPKFKIGDWITDGRLTCKVLSVTGKSYELHLHNDDYCHFETDVQSVDKRYHLWTIEDAKDGDVLVHNGYPFIFMGVKDGIVQALEENLLEGTNPVNFGEPKIDKDYQPAIKEQRDLLYSKMKQEGYEWDSERNELKKVEQGNHPRIVMADFTGGEGFYKLNLDNLNEEQVFAIEIMINNPKPGKKIDADKVIEWLKNNGWCTVGGPKVEMAQINKFKNDFGL